MDGSSHGVAPRPPPSSANTGPDNSKGGSVEKAGGFSGTGPPGGHSRLSSADSGIQVDSGWDSLTRYLAKVAIDPVTTPDPRISQKTIYSCHTERPAPLDRNGKSCKFQSAPDLSSPRVKATMPQRGFATVTSTSALGMASVDDVRGRTTSPEAEVIPASGGTKSRTVSRRPGVTRRINIKVMGPKSSSKDSTEKEGDVRGDTALAHCPSDNPKNVVTKTLKTNVPATIELPDVQTQQTSSRSVRLPSVPKRLELGSESLAPASRQCSSELLSERDTTSDSMRLEITCSPSKSSVVYWPSSSSVDRSVALEPAPSNKMLGSSGPTIMLASQPRLTSALSPLSKPLRTDDNNPSPLTLLTSSTPVIPTLSPQGEGVASPKDWVIGGRGMFSSQSGLSSQGIARSGCPQTTVTASSSSDALSRTPDAHRGIRVFQDGHKHEETVSGPSQHSQPKTLSVPVRFTKKNVSDEKPRNFDSCKREHSHIKVLCGSAQPSTRVQVGTEKLQVPQNQSVSAVPHVLGRPPQSSSQSVCVGGTPVESFQRLVIPSVNSSQPAASTAAPKLSMTSVRPVTSSHQFSSLSSPHHAVEKPHSPQQSSLCVTTLSQPGLSAPIFRSKLSPVLPRHTHRIRLPLTPSPAPTLLQPIPTRHVNVCDSAHKADSSPGPPCNQSPASATAQSVNMTSVSSNGAVTSSPPEVLLKLLEMTAVVRGREEGGGGAGGERSRGERRIPVVDARKNVPWKERRKWMDSALSWLREELESLRAMDTELVTQFRRCQESIESLKQQQSERIWGDGEGSEWGWGWGLEGSEMDEEEGAWEDWEIAEFEKKWSEDPNAKQRGITSPMTSSSSGNDDVTAEGDATSTETASSLRENSHSPFLQDVEASL